ncbi:MAG TPA: YCF48-related protein [Opitutus sp.]|nr:YCF48-related protein [Opitutus sp.]
MVAAGLRACRLGSPISRQAETPAATHRPATLTAAFAALLLALALSASAAPVVARALLLDAARAGPAIVAVGEHATIVLSGDSGRTWESAAVAPGLTATLTGVAFAADAQRGWAVGHDALVLATTDGGRTWARQWQGHSLEASFLDVCALDAQHVIAIGAYGLYLATADGGRTWTPRRILDDDMHLNRITRGPTGTLYLAGERGTLLRSRDAGDTWERIDSPYDGSFYGILPLGAHDLIAYGLRGRVFRSTNDGDAWEPVALDRPMLITTAVAMEGPAPSGPSSLPAIVLAGQARALFRSDDGGRTFAPWPHGLESAVAELLVAPDGTLLAFGEDGVTRLEHP